jgi:hypothetical protein
MSGRVDALRKVPGDGTSPQDDKLNFVISERYGNRVRCHQRDFSLVQISVITKREVIKNENFN